VWLLIQAVILGIVEGLTEFLPVSSTGHLIVTGVFIDYPERQRATFEIFIQLGAIVAVFWHYRRELLDLAVRAPREAPARDLALKVAVAFVPAAVIGFLFHHWIEAHLFSVRTVAGALIVGGVILLAVERRPLTAVVDSIEQARWRDAVGVGIAQVFSLFPGISRAGATIVGGLLTGMSRPASTQFSFYLALPTITAASLFSLWKSLSHLTAADALPLSVGFLAAFASALIVIRLFIAYVQTHDFRIFGYYRIVAGIVLLLVT
jgi:undecaprenyl-diphosphatase